MGSAQRVLVRQQEPIIWLDTKERGHARREAAALEISERMTLTLQTEVGVLCGYSLCGYYKTFLQELWDHPPSDGGRALYKKRRRCNYVYVYSK